VGENVCRNVFKYVTRVTVLSRHDVHATSFIHGTELDTLACNGELWSERHS
jgi:hypothetical protein